MICFTQSSQRSKDANSKVKSKNSSSLPSLSGEGLGVRSKNLQIIQINKSISRKVRKGAKDTRMQRKK